MEDRRNGSRGCCKFGRRHHLCHNWKNGQLPLILPSSTPHTTYSSLLPLSLSLSLSLSLTLSLFLSLPLSLSPSLPLSLSSLPQYFYLHFLLPPSLSQATVFLSSLLPTSLCLPFSVPISPYLFLAIAFLSSMFPSSVSLLPISHFLSLYYLSVVSACSLYLTPTSSHSPFFSPSSIYFCISFLCASLFFLFVYPLYLLSLIVFFLFFTLSLSSVLPFSLFRSSFFPLFLIIHSFLFHASLFLLSVLASMENEAHTHTHTKTLTHTNTHTHTSHCTLPSPFLAHTYEMKIMLSLPHTHTLSLENTFTQQNTLF